MLARGHQNDIWFIVLEEALVTSGRNVPSANLVARHRKVNVKFAKSYARLDEKDLKRAAVGRY